MTNKIIQGKEAVIVDHAIDYVKKLGYSVLPCSPAMRLLAMFAAVLLLSITGVIAAEYSDCSIYGTCRNNVTLISSSSGSGNASAGNDTIWQRVTSFVSLQNIDDWIGIGTDTPQSKLHVVANSEDLGGEFVLTVEDTGTTEDSVGAIFGISGIFAGGLAGAPASGCAAGGCFSGGIDSLVMLATENMSGNFSGGNISMNLNSINDVVNPSLAQDVATKNYVDIHTDSYALMGSHAAHNHVDSSTYYYGSRFSTVATNTPNNAPIIIPRSGVITSIYIAYRATGAGSSENMTYNLIINNTSTKLITSTARFDALTGTNFNGSLNIPVTAGDTLELSFITPAYATNPTAVFESASIYIDGAA